MGNILDQLEETGVDVRQLIENVPETYDWRVHFWLDMESSRLKTTDVAGLLPEFLISNRYVRDCSADVCVTDTITTKYYFDVNCDIITPQRIYDVAEREWELKNFANDGTVFHTTRNGDTMMFNTHKKEFIRQVVHIESYLGYMRHIARTVFSLIAFAHDSYECSFWNEVEITYLPTRNELGSQPFTYVFGRDIENTETAY